ncbi:methylated-DNA-protein-cysteine methyltransferase related protein [Pseudoalteromonas ulvae UL12]|uniref:Cysteine methyltransferase n=1 Tax=Pseudoalteromonas ulvae TaxID=107327 RepID=A0A244CRE1_PSEDV|nr:MGMT family protein [Pseudoalteromonas ulvae]MBE0366146.1 methylated-DNA-protein-cysteine methyltransferase related protein [Pseudoalteromonas ulvae UL12]OUL58138.1 cysteine methyltransferase [Pseudoalteromonas ulvae]
MARQKEERNELESKQAHIWTVVGAVPAGTVASYGQVAKLAGLPGYARFVGRCLKDLPEGSTLPWYRIINSQGKISFAKDSEKYLKQLNCLQKEGIIFRNDRVDLKKYQWKV